MAIPLELAETVREACLCTLFQAYPMFSKFCRPPAPKPRFSGKAGRAVHAGSIT